MIGGACQCQHDRELVTPRLRVLLWRVATELNTALPKSYADYEKGEAGTQRGAREGGESKGKVRDAKMALRRLRGAQSAKSRQSATEEVLGTP